MQRISIAFFAVFAMLAVWSGCKQINDPITNDSNGTTIVTAVGGQVVDETGTPVQGATVAAYGKSAVTNQYGVFLIQSVSSPKDRCLVKVSKNGYFNAFRAEQPAAGQVTQMRIGMMSNAAQGSFSAAAGKTVNANGSSASVEFPAGGYVAETGAQYSGQVSYVVRHLNPAATNFFDFFAGDFLGVRTDGSTTEMLSYGVLRVELRGSNGEKLNLGAGKTATVSYPIPQGMASAAPAESPLWVFDETKGMWKEEGVSKKQGNFYVGTVSHFSEWNCDVPARTATLRVHVTCSGKGVSGVVVRIGQRTAITDANGYANGRAPEGIAFVVKVHPEQNDGLESAEINAGPYSGGSSADLDLPLTTCPALIVGKTFDCGDTQINAAVIAEFAGGGFSYSFSQNGEFRLRVRPGAVVTAKAMSSDGKESEPIVVPPLTFGQEHNVGEMHICKASSTTANDYDLNVGLPNSIDFYYYVRPLITADGTRTFVFYGGKATIVNTSTGEIVRTIQYSTPASVDSLDDRAAYDISSDGSLMLVRVSVSLRKYALYDANSGTKLREFDGYETMTLSPDGATAAAYKVTNPNTEHTHSVAIINTATGSIIAERNVIKGEPFFIFQLTDFFTNSTFGITEYSLLGRHMTILNSGDLSMVKQIPIQYMGVVAQSPDGSVVALVYYKEQSLQFYTIESGASSIVNIQPRPNGSENIDIAPSNDRFVAQLQDLYTGQYSAPALFDIATGAMIKPLPSVNNARYYGFQFSANGEKLVSVYIENNRLKLHVWSF